MHFLKLTWGATHSSKSCMQRVPVLRDKRMFSNLLLFCGHKRLAVSTTHSFKNSPSEKGLLTAATRVRFLPVVLCCMSSPLSPIPSCRSLYHKANKNAKRAGLNNGAGQVVCLEKVSGFQTPSRSESAGRRCD